MNCCTRIIKQNSTMHARVTTTTTNIQLTALPSYVIITLPSLHTVQRYIISLFCTGSKLNMIDTEFTMWIMPMK